MKLKVCGMKYNTQEVADLQPDFLGFIFWEPSKRYFNGAIPELDESIKKVGVFVDAKIDDVLSKVAEFNLWSVQLHGEESPDYCKELAVRASGVETLNSSTVSRLKIIKVFSIKDNFDFEQLKQFEAVCDYYLFDTKGKLPGGNGYAFNWEILREYPSTKPYFLSGGIGLEEIDAIKEFMKQPEAKYCRVIDVNSKLEDEPGLKNIEKLKEFKETLGQS